MSQTPAVSARGLTKAFDGKEVVCGIDLAVPRGGCFGFLGPNGAGKTTTLRMILGQSPVTSGELEVLSVPVSGNADVIRARCGVVPQTDNLDPDFTVVENLRMYAGYFGLGGSEVDNRAKELLRFVELEDRADSKIRTLSGGMKRRLSIGRALINDPELIILDEPTTGLDPQARHLIWARLRQLKNTGKTLLLTTHFMEEAERLCDDLVVIDHGHIIAQGSPRHLIESHVEPHVIELHDNNGSVVERFVGLEDFRAEVVGDTHYLYANEIAPVVDRLEQEPAPSFAHRKASLEDVFLKLTGRDLRD